MNIVNVKSVCVVLALLAMSTAARAITGTMDSGWNYQGTNISVSLSASSNPPLGGYIDGQSFNSQISVYDADTGTLVGWYVINVSYNKSGYQDTWTNGSDGTSSTYTFAPDWGDAFVTIPVTEGGHYTVEIDTDSTGGDWGELGYGDSLQQANDIFDLDWSI